jgi:hypothetical protein
MKKFILFAAVVCLVSTLRATPVHPPIDPVNESSAVGKRALAHFKANFADAENVAWSKTDKAEPCCHFRRGNKETRVFYDKNGNWQYTLESFLPALLDAGIAEQIQQAFPKYKLTFVNEILSDSDPVYIVNIEDAGHIKVVQVTDGDLMVTKSMAKQ